MHISHNAPYLPPKILHNLCFSFLLGITAVLRDIENNDYVHFSLFLVRGEVGGGGEQIRCIMGNVEVAYCRKSLRKMTCIVVNGQCAGDRKRRPHTNLIAGDKKVLSESCKILKSERMNDVK